MSSFRRVFAELWAGVILLGAGICQEAPDRTIRITVNLVQVDAVVTDAAGRQVTDLAAKDFEVFQDGEPQKITNFSYVPNETSRPLDRAQNSDAATPLLSRSPTRTVAVVVDDLGLSAESAVRVRAALRRFVNEQIAPGDLIAIIRTSGGVGALQQFTRNKSQLLAAIDRIHFNALARAAVGDPAVPGESGDVRASANELDEFRESVLAVGTLGAIRFVVDGLRNLPGRKAVILLSDRLRVAERDRALEKGMQGRQGRGLGGPTQRDERVMAALSQLTDLCNRASVVMYTIDPRGVQTLGFTAADQPQASGPDGFAAELSEKSPDYLASQTGLDLLAHETGGLFIHDNNDINLGLRRALQDQSGYYLIGYTPAESTFAAKSGRLFHKIKVQVKRRGVRVRTRTGFFGVPDRDVQPPKTGASDQLLTALTSPFANGAIHLRLTPLFSYSDQKGALVHALLHIDGHDLAFASEPGGWHEAVLDVVMMTFGDDSTQAERSAETFKVRVHGEEFKRALDSGLVFSLDHPVKKAGAYQFRCAVRDAGSTKVGSASEFIEVPDVSRGQLALSGILMHGFNAGKPGVGASEPPNPLENPAVRVFKPGDRLEWEVAILNAHVNRATERPDVRLQLRLLRDGKEEYAGKLLPVHVDERTDVKQFRTGGSLRLGSNLATGVYDLELPVVDESEKHRSTKQSIDFEIRH